MHIQILREHSGSVVKCLTRDGRAEGSSLTRDSALCPWARHNNPCLVLVQPRRPFPTYLQNCWLGCKELNQRNKIQILQMFLHFLHIMLNSLLYSVILLFIKILDIFYRWLHTGKRAGFFFASVIIFFYFSSKRKCLLFSRSKYKDETF